MKRLLTALIALPIIILAVILPYIFPEQAAANWLFFAIAGVALTFGLYEFYLLSKKLELKADAGIGYLGAAGMFVAFLFDAPSKAPDLLFLTIAFFVMLVLVTQTFRFQKDFTKMFAGIGVTILGVFYVAFLGGFLVAARVGFDGAGIPHLSTKLLAFFFLVTMGADTGAYYVGKNLGKHKLVPKISPGKTWEGLTGGILAGVALAGMSSFTFFPELNYRASLPLALVMAVVGLFGDLAESAMKRGAGAKDAASILPGHGGILDRLDSLLFNAPILYYFARFYF
jgi:phosphatidate cytidylyltransferase